VESTSTKPAKKQEQYTYKKAFKSAIPPQIIEMKSKQLLEKQLNPLKFKQNVTRRDLTEQRITDSILSYNTADPQMTDDLFIGHFAYDDSPYHSQQRLPMKAQPRGFHSPMFIGQVQPYYLKSRSKRVPSEVGLRVGLHRKRENWSQM
jgi:hypothetical protein